MRGIVSVAFFLLRSVQLQAQMFTPPASALPDGQLNQSYGAVNIEFTVPATTTIDGQFVEQAIGIVYPQAATVIGLLGLAGQSFDFIVERVTLVPNGLPAGMMADCNATPCIYMSGTSGELTISGTPTESGQFSMDIMVLAEGEADISSIGGGILSQFGIPASFALPTPVPSDLTEEGYTLQVADPSGIVQINPTFGLSMYPNPVVDRTTLAVSSRIDGIISVDLYDGRGSRVTSGQYLIRPGDNRIELDLTGSEAGMYLIQARMQNQLALIRVQKL